MVQWLGLCVFTAKGPGLITRVPQTVCCSQKKKPQKNPQKTKKQAQNLGKQSPSIILVVSPCDLHSLSRIVSLFAIILPPEHRTEP